MPGNPTFLPPNDPPIHGSTEGATCGSIASSAAGQREGWRPIATVERENGRRLILAWDDCPSLPYHWEVGRWSRTLGWVNTYGHAFSGEPTHWMEPPAPSASPSAPEERRDEVEDDPDTPEARLQMVRAALQGIIDGHSPIALARAGIDFIDLTEAQRAEMRGDQPE